MKTLRLLFPLVFAATIAAQGMPKPSQEMTKYDAMLGNWTGSGTTSMAEGEEGMPWTLTSTGKKILGGFAVQVDTKLDVGMPTPLAMREIYYYDAERKRHSMFRCSNHGGAMTSDVDWQGHKLIAHTRALHNGMLQNLCWVIDHRGDEQRLVGYASMDGKPFFTHVEGTMKRGGDGCDFATDSTDEAMVPAGDHLAPVMRLKGRWQYTGWVDMPGTGKQAIGGTEHVRSAFGGHVLEARVIDDKTPYRGHSYQYWSDTDNCIKMFGLNNFGEAHSATVYPDDDGLAIVFAGRSHGTVMAGRHVSRFEGADKIVGHTTALIGDEAKRTMAITLERRKTTKP